MWSGLASRASAQLTVSLEIAPVSAAGPTYLVEAFITNTGAPVALDGVQIDLPCDLPGKPGSGGTVEATPGVACVSAADCPLKITGGGNVACTLGVCESLSVGNASHASSGSTPWLFAPQGACTGGGNDGTFCKNDGACTGGGTCDTSSRNGGLRPIAQAACRLAGSKAAGEPPYFLATGKRYIGSWRYKADACAGGTFNIPYEIMTMPCLQTNLSIVVGGDGLCISALFNAGAIVIKTGDCCDGTNCRCDGVSQACCTNLAAAGRPAACLLATAWNEGKACFLADGTTPNPIACACTLNSQCDDGQFCNGAETCNTANGQCVAGTPPVCPGTTNCANGICDPTNTPGTAGANGPNAAGSCEVVNKADGLACSVNGEVGGPPCNNADTCLAGVCNENLAGAGVACGSSGSGECDNADTCDGAGNCLANNISGPCTDDTNPCTDDACAAGVCTHTNDDTNACSDDINCTDTDHCSAGACLSSQKVCFDGLACTLDDCDEGTGECFFTDISTIGCIDATDCPDVPCVNGRCLCVENPDCLLQPHKDATGSNCHEEGDQVIVDFYFGGTPPTLCIGGGSMRITYDPTCLQFVSADPGDAPWTNEIFEQVSNGVIFYAVGSQIGGGAVKCSSDAGVMARFTFTKIGDCNACDLCLTTLNPQHTRLTTAKGQEVLCAALGCSKTIFDAGVISHVCPGNIPVNSDCNRTTAVVTWDPISFVDECDGALLPLCTCIHANADGPTPFNCNGLTNSGGTFPQGSFTFSCSAKDDNCNEKDKCEWTVTVSDQQTLDVHLQLSPTVDNDGFKRCICFEMISSCSPLVMEEVCQTIDFGGPFQFPGQAEGSVKVPKGKYVCVQARDRQHSLRATHFPLVCDGHHYGVTFKGDPFFGGNWLIQGNLNRDPLIDILDFGTFLGQLNQNPNPDKDKLCSDEGGLGGLHADFNGDGNVDVGDYTFIQINFLANDKDDCCHNGSAGSDAVGRTEVSVKELNEMGMGELAIADLNNDGFLNTEDMAAFVQGVRPKGTINRGNVGRPSTIRGSR
jgi:hypothetical protein